MAAKSTYQFMRIQGFPRGSKSKRGTLGSILAEGTRQPTHISHLEHPPNIRVDRLASPVDSPEELQAWINGEMSEARNSHVQNNRVIERAVRQDALAIGTVIVSHAKTTRECPKEELDDFIEDTTRWVEDLLSDFDMLPHFRLTHLDEKHPHLHFWFTPKPNDQREVNWALSALCGQTKGFYHNLQKRFFEDVGHKYFTERAKPIDERDKRLPRHIAVMNRGRDENTPGLEEGAPRHVPTPTVRSVSDLIERLGAKAASDKLGLRDTVLSEKAQSIIQTLGMAPNIQPDPKAHEGAVAAEQEKQKALSEELSDLKGRLMASESQEPSALPSIGPWLDELLFPIILSVAFQQGGRAEHLGEEQWLTLVIEEAGAMLEETLKRIGLSQEGLGGQISDAISDSAFVERVLQARHRSEDQKRKLLSPDRLSEGRRLSSPGKPSEGGSPWDNAIPR